MKSANVDKAAYHQSALEQAREKDLLRLFEILPKGMGAALEIGARDGYYTRILTGFFESVAALDLERPDFQIDRVKTVRGDVTQLHFPDDFFDCVVATEVLEHVPEIERACHEISRVSKKYVIIGVPYRQDIRVGRTTCLSCGRISPPWGHINAFWEGQLRSYFSEFEVVESSFVGENRDRTNRISAWLMDLGGNPRGTYNQKEACVNCGAKLVAPRHRSTLRRMSSGLAHRINRIQSLFTRPCPNWIHILFRKNSGRPTD